MRRRESHCRACCATMTGPDLGRCPVTYPPHSAPSQPSSAPEPPSWRRGEVERLIEQLVAGDELLHRVFLIEHPRATARLVLDAAEGLQTGMAALRALLYGRRENDRPLALVPAQGEPLPFD